VCSRAYLASIYAICRDGCYRPSVESTTPVGPGIQTTFPGLGTHVLVERGPGLPPVEAEILAHNFHRPHLVRVAYLRAPAAEWIFRSRIAGPVLSWDR
jgi:hypothetical protein